MVYIWIVIGLLFAMNMALTVYFFNKFEKMFIIMKASSLKDLVDYYKKMDAIKTKKEEDDEFNDMP